MAQILVAGRNISATDLKVIMYNVPLLQCQNVDLSKAKQREMVGGMGSAEPVALEEGPNTYSGSIDVAEDDLKAMRQAIAQLSPSGSFVDVAPSTITMTATVPGNTHTVTVFNVAFISDGYSVGTTSGKRMTRLPFVCSGINFI